MAEVVLPGEHGRHVGSIGGLAMPGGPRIEMIQNPDFSFPRHPPRAPPRQNLGSDSTKRPVSMHGLPSSSSNTTTGHRRAVSTLPGFSFNAEDTSGRQDADVDTPPLTPTLAVPAEPIPITPSRRGHRRGGSELVGGDPRLGVSTVVSSSPTKESAFSLPVPVPAPAPGRRGHAHRRSAAISSHDIGSLMQSNEPQPRLSTSLPSTPMEFPGQDTPYVQADSAPIVPQQVVEDPFGPPLEDDDVLTRPPSRPRVEFSDNVEYIPRPLSTISSETESSLSTIRGHSVNNSISSVLSLGTPSPPSARLPLVTRKVSLEEENKPRAKSSLEISKRVEREGEWLKSRSSASLHRPSSETTVTAPRTTFLLQETSLRPHASHNKKRSISHVLGLDRRRSEPSFGVSTGESPRLSALSLQDSVASTEIPPPERPHSGILEHIPSTRRLKLWAVAKISKKSKEVPTRALSECSSRSSMRLDSVSEPFVPGKVDYVDPPVAETDLDTVFGNEDVRETPSRPGTPSQPAIEVSASSPGPRNDLVRTRETDDESPVLDLDAALGPFKTPPLGTHRQRRELHSSRHTRDFNNSRANFHRRAESAPALAPFEGNRVTTATAAMADVFEEEEEENTESPQPSRSESPHSKAEDELGIGIQIVDSDLTSNTPLSKWTFEEGLGIRNEWAPDRSSTSYSNVASRLSTPCTERRPSSIVEETIVEEVVPEEPIEIVEAHEEPRASSLTKSSDSSETPTLLGAPTGTMLSLPDATNSLMTPDTYQASTFSSPDLCRRQGSFDTSRLGTSASSITDNRTMSSCTTSAAGDPNIPDFLRMSVDDVPSLTSSRSTMLSMPHANGSRHDLSSGGDRTPAATVRPIDPTTASDRRRSSKRASIQSLSQLVGGSFGSRSKSNVEATRPQTAGPGLLGKNSSSQLRLQLEDQESREQQGQQKVASQPKKEHRLKKLLFWKSKQSGKSRV